MEPAKPRTRTPVDYAAAHASIVAVLVLAYYGLAAALGLPQLRAAPALALSIGLGSALVTMLQRRATLGVLWAELTAWIGFAFLIASCWNALFLPFEIIVAIDLALGLAVLLLGFNVARAAKRQAVNAAS